jgi:flagellar motor switch protein FliM
MLECSFSAELGMSGLRAPVGALSQLAAGQLLMLGKGAVQPAALLVAGVEMFCAAPARRGDRRVAQILALADEPKALRSGSPVDNNKETKK